MIRSTLKRKADGVLMKRASYTLILVMAILLLTTSIITMVAAGQAKNSDTVRDAVAVHSRREATASKKPQWSADPEHGWVRTDESHRTEAGYKSSTSAKQKMEKTQGNGKQKGKKIK
jgi:hypothetical protein